MIDIDKIQENLASLRGQPNSNVIRAAIKLFSKVPKKPTPKDWKDRGLTYPNGPVQQWIMRLRSEQCVTSSNLDMTSDDALETLALIYLEEFAEE